jgi:hypothetical protein
MLEDKKFDVEQTRQVSNEEVDCSAAFESEARFFRDQGKNPDEQGDLASVRLSERHSDSPERLFGTSDQVHLTWQAGAFRCRNRHLLS